MKYGSNYILINGGKKIILQYENNIRITEFDKIKINKALKKSIFNLNNEEKKYINMFLGIIALSSEFTAYQIINDFNINKL